MQFELPVRFKILLQLVCVRSDIILLVVLRVSTFSKSSPPLAPASCTRAGNNTISGYNNTFSVNNNRLHVQHSHRENHKLQPGEVNAAKVANNEFTVIKRFHAERIIYRI